MLIGHVTLAPKPGDSAGHIVALVSALERAGVRQHVLVNNNALADRIAAIGGVDVGPAVHSPVMACCLMPQVDVVHVHESAAGKTGLLLTLTRSVPYVLTHRGAVRSSGSPLLQSIYRRARAVVCQDEGDVALLRHWLPGLTVEVIPDFEPRSSAGTLLRLYQNSQRMPMAGNNGNQ